MPSSSDLLAAAGAGGTSPILQSLFARIEAEFHNLAQENARLQLENTKRKSAELNTKLSIFSSAVAVAAAAQPFPLLPRCFLDCKQNKVTSRDRPKSAPYLRLKSSKTTSNIKVFSSTAPEIFLKSLTMPKKLKGGPFGISQHPFCRKTPKN